jgi:hypothetical protein
MHEACDNDNGCKRRSRDRLARDNDNAVSIENANVKLVAARVTLRQRLGPRRHCKDNASGVEEPGEDGTPQVREEYV